MPMLDPAGQQALGQQPPPEETPEDLEPAISPTGQGQGGVVHASKEEQDQLDRTVGRAVEMIYDDNMFDQVVEMLRGGGGEGAGEGDPVHGLAMATEMVVARVAQMAEQAGTQIAPDVLYHAGADVLEELAEVSRRAKIKDYAQDKDGLEKAWFTALDMFRDRLAQAGELDQESAGSDLDRLVEMDQNGTLEKIMRELADSDESGPAGGPEPEPDVSRQGKPRGFATAMGLGG